MYEQLVTRQKAKQALRLPALFLILISCLGILFSLLEIISPSDSLQTLLPHGQNMLRFKVVDLSGVAGLTLTSFTLYGALQMRAVENYVLCMVAAILACIPCSSPCCVFTTPFGIWALVTLSQARVRAGFSPQ